jgi:small subunit ribosomal protein S16
VVKIRLMRVGKKKQPSYRVVVADSRSPRDGRIIEAIGHYQPRLEPSGVLIDNDRAVYWLQQGAQPSEQVRKLLELTGAWSEFSGEAPKARLEQPEASPSEAAAAKAKATPAASVAGTTETEDETGEATAAEAAPPAEPETPAEPEAEAEPETEEQE